jgi:hypothetical protein
MAKIIDVPTSGKIGLTVTWPGRNGLIRRAWVSPSNPNTGHQAVVRANLTAAARAYDALTEPQQNAWIAAGANAQTRAHLGQSGPLTGLQLFTKINCALLAVGGTMVNTPPTPPTIDPLPITGLVITNTGGNVALKLTTTDSPPDGTMLWGCAPANSGVRRPVSPRFLGQLDSPVGNLITITTLYTDKFGAPEVGKRLIVQVNANVDGYEGPRVTFQALVPASS